MTEDNGRTHEPSLREVVAELDGLRDLMKSEDHRLEAVMDERHERYKERADAAEDRVGVAFDAAKEAKTASDQGQRDYNVSHNDILRKADQQYKDTLPREEALTRFGAQEAKIDQGVKEAGLQMDQLRKDVQGLRESRSEGSGTAALLGDLTREIQSLRSTQNLGTGRGIGLNAAWAYIVAAVGCAGVVFTGLLAIGALALETYRIANRL
ncbi:MAG TPA: hypothetical protein VGU71_22540 [Candidatus Dormibacteraeota bacterium]|nr:hypothetical protein [Candidatus Dormibacteraeota bacterium]